MFGLFGKKRREPAIREVLFGDLPISAWPNEATPARDEPWLSFATAREHLESKRAPEAIAQFRNILAMPGLESRHYAQAWHFLREAGISPEATEAKDVLGVVVEVGLPDGLDIVVAYADGSARYFSYSGAGVVWDAPDHSLDEPIANLLRTGRAVAEQIGPWLEKRPAAPGAGQARVNMLTPSGLHFGQAPLDVLAKDPLGGPVVVAALQLMQGLVAKTRT